MLSLLRLERQKKVSTLAAENGKERMPSLDDKGHEYGRSVT